MKKIVSLLLAMVLAFALIALTACGANDEIIVNTNAFFAPFEYYDGTEIKGVDVDIMNMVGEKLGKKVVFENTEFSAIIDNVAAGKVCDAGAAGITITDIRKEKVDFSTPYYYATIVTLVKNDSAFASAKSVADLKGATGTSQLGTIWYDNCLGQIPEVNMLPAQETAPAMLVALNAGTCDVVVTDRPTGSAALSAYSGFKMLDFFGTDGDYEVSDEDINIGISVQKGNTAVLDAINAVLGNMTTDDYDALMNDAIAVQPLAD